MICAIADKQELIHALGDLGMEPKLIDQFIQSIRLRQWDNGKRILASHRSKLLSDVHESQDKLYCMDFLIRGLKSNEALCDKGEGVTL